MENKDYLEVGDRVHIVDNYGKGQTLYHGKVVRRTKTQITVNHELGGNEKKFRVKDGTQIDPVYCRRIVVKGSCRPDNDYCREHDRY